MTITEFSDQFDVLYNNVTSNQAPGLNEYEKSVFLTKGQDEVIKNYFLHNSKGNTLQEGFDGNAKRQIDFSMLMRTKELTALGGGGINIHPGSNTKYYPMPNDILVYINEAVKVRRGGNTVQLTVIPLSYDDYNRLMSKPFKRPLKYQAWRLITSGASSSYTYTDYPAIASILAGMATTTASAESFLATINGKELSIGEYDGDSILGVDDKYILANATLGPDSAALDITSTQSAIVNKFDVTVPASSTIVELIPGNNDVINTYTVRYVARPKPIILTDLSSEGLSIGGNFTSPQNCELDPILHEEILQRAVELAKVAWTATGQDNAQMVMQAGQRSE